MTRLTSDSIYKRDGDEIIALPVGDERSEVFLAQAARVIVAMRRDAALPGQSHDRSVENFLVGDLRAQCLTQLAQLHGRAVRGRRVESQHPLKNQSLQVVGAVMRRNACGRG